MDYRNDLEAARLRINTLEAKLEETKASLNARDAELAECRVERDKLRQKSQGKEPSHWKFVAIGAGVLLLGLGLGYASGVQSSPTYASAWGTVPQGSWSPSKDPGDHTKMEGKIQPPPEPPAPPPPATVSGETNTPPGEVTIDSIIQDARPHVQACYRAEAKAHPKRSGSVKVVL
ncbi:MAG TPA: hypothetical protein PK156_15565, partial [Polyangium sp.]|nr:hypothetical protein [Polyangium sp.]